MSGLAQTDGLLARCGFPPVGSVVACAVSGGADSLALLVLAVRAGCVVTAVHVDHCLRAGSGNEAELVRVAATRFGAQFRAERVRVEQGPNLEARARQARYGVLPADVLTGHTADDQAETILLNLMRGSGLDGLAGMSASRRPLLGLRRAETVQLCDVLGLVPFADPSNIDPAYRRNRVRQELLPLLDDIAGRDIAALLARQAPVLRDEATFLDGLAAELDPTDARSLRAAPKALARRAVRRWLSNPYPPDAATVERVLEVAAGESRACEVGGRRRVERHLQRLFVSRSG